MSEMVERVGIAIYRRAWANAGPTLTSLDELDDDQRAHVLSVARAAIEAMREPTGEMIDAGAATMPIDPLAAPDWISGQPSKCWCAMIDAAPQEGGA